MMPFVYSNIKTSWGWLGALKSVKGMCRLTLPQPSSGEALDKLGPAAKNAEYRPEQFNELSVALLSYFDGVCMNFDVELDLDGHGEFYRRVWRLACTIPIGETRSYSWLAQMAGNPLARRAVGRAMSSNPIPLIIPCHRVISHDGSLGGYGGSFSGRSSSDDQNLALKRRLLRLEGAIK